MDGYIRDSKERYFLLKPNRTAREGQFAKHEWLGMKVTNILPALVSQQFRVSAQNND
jgi:hypothetical protein